MLSLCSSIAVFLCRVCRECVRQRLLKDVLGVADVTEAWRVMILDDHATKVVSSIVGMYDITEASASAMVEDINKPRQPFKDMDAVYILDPCDQSVDKLKADFPNKKEALYKRVHLYFLEPVPDVVMESIRGCPELLRRVKSFKEINLDFVLSEVQTFHLGMGVEPGMPSLFRTLYGPGTGGSSVLSVAAQRLVTLCSTLREFPYVRYSGTSPRAEAVARDFQNKMNMFIAGASDWSFHGQDSTSERGRSTLLVMDRADDPLTPLMHDFTYQCLVQEVLPVTNGRIEMDSKNAAAAGQPPAKKEALLNEADELWVELRHEHVAKVLTELDRRFKEVLRDNSEAAALVKGGGRQMTLEQMANATRGLPEFQARCGHCEKPLTKKLSQHINMAQSCSTKISTMDLLNIGALEQTMALGTDELGKKRNRRDLLDGWTSDGEAKPGLLEILSAPRTLQELKMRLLAIFIITQKGITASEKEELYSAAQLSYTDRQVLANLGNLGVHTGEPDRDAIAGKTGGFSFGRKSTPKGSGEDEHEFSHMRYTCPAKPIIEKLILDELPIEDHPSVLPLPEGKAQRRDTSTSSSTAATGGKSARRQVKDRGAGSITVCMIRL
ncbi:Sec1-like protein [Tribonema minus]|uniref:Sec1-like protein n=1 Tax=Tribonema minus TaxID=303371 RepID=A0A835YPU4_9STRA|nr:Sec1-like protein [Tribonema minus]